MEGKRLFGFVSLIKGKKNIFFCFWPGCPLCIGKFSWVCHIAKQVVVGRTTSRTLHLRLSLTPACMNQVQPSSEYRQGAISPQTSPLPSGSLSYPPPTQEPVTPPKRVGVGRAEVLRLRLRRSLAPASKNKVQPSSGCRQGGDFTSILATALWNPRSSAQQSTRGHRTRFMLEEG